MIKPWETLGRERLATTPVFAIDIVDRRSPAGKEAQFFVADIPDWVNVVAITPEEQLVLIRQYRQGTDTITLEIPGGVVDEGESFLEAAGRELLEETGYGADELIEIGVVEPNPALQNNRCATVLAVGACPLGEPDFDEHEECEVELSPLAVVEEKVRTGEITHALVVAALYHYDLRSRRG